MKNGAPGARKSLIYKDFLPGGAWPAAKGVPTIPYKSDGQIMKIKLAIPVDESIMYP
jgi:hypothetical protein